MCIDPNNPNRIAIGWRQFDSTNSNFRQGGYAFSNRREVAEKGESQFAANCGKCVAVKEEKRSPLMKLPQLIEKLGETQRLALDFLPVFRARDSSF